MANRIQPHPNPPYWLSDGTLNANGQLKLFAAGTATPKVAYKDASGTSYGSTIDLDSAGLPDEGPIYWDTSALYKVEIYKDDGAGGYALDDTIDNFGEIVTDAISILSSATSWTVDGVGGSSTTFATISAAMDAARTYTISGDGELTINVNAGTYTDEGINFYHPQGEKIKLVGAGSGSTSIVHTSDTNPTVYINSGAKFGEISGFTITNNSSAGTCVDVARSASLLYLNSCVLDGGTGGDTGLTASYDAFIFIGSITIQHCDGTFLQVWHKASVEIEGTLTIDDSANTGATSPKAIQVQGGGAVLDILTVNITGHATNKLGYGLYCRYDGYISVVSLSITNADIGTYVEYGGKVYILDTTPTYSGVTTNYDPATVDTLDTGTTSKVGTLIWTA